MKQVCDLFACNYGYKRDSTRRAGWSAPSSENILLLLSRRLLRYYSIFTCTGKSCLFLCKLVFWEATFLVNDTTGLSRNATQRKLEDYHENVSSKVSVGNPSTYDSSFSFTTKLNQVVYSFVTCKTVKQKCSDGCEESFTENQRATS